jgi:hypothetical protein
MTRARRGAWEGPATTVGWDGTGSQADFLAGPGEICTESMQIPARESRPARRSGGRAPKTGLGAADGQGIVHPDHRAENRL